MANTVNYGLRQLLDMGAVSGQVAAATVDRDLLVSAINYDVATYNREVNSILNFFSDPVTEPQKLIEQGFGRRNQPLDEFGRTIPIKGPAPYTVGFPIVLSGNAQGTTFIASQRMTVDRLASTLEAMRRGDAEWVRDHVLAALFKNGSYTYTDPEFGALTVYGLASGDSTTYVRTSGGAASADTHYYAQAADIADASNPFPTLHTEIVEHPMNGLETIALIATDLKADTEGLADFIAEGDDAITEDQTAARLRLMPNVSLPARAMLIGKIRSGPWVAEWPDIPSGYGIVMPLNPAVKPLARREYPEANLRGFRPQGERDDWPYFEEQWMRAIGFGAHNRTGAVVFRIGNASYAIPTGYESPMP